MEVGGKYKLLMIRTKYLKNALELSKEIFQKAYVSFMSELDHKVNSSKRPTEKSKKKSQENKQASSDVSTEQRVEPEPDIEVQKDLKDENLKQVFKEIALVQFKKKCAKVIRLLADASTNTIITVIETIAMVSTRSAGIVNNNRGPKRPLLVI